MRTRLHRTIQGTNQYQTKSRILGLKVSTWKNINFVCGILLLVGYFGHMAALKDVDLHRHLISPLAMTAYAYDAPQWKMPELATPETATEVKALIRKIWGRDSATGLAIARCESGYRPGAVNHNTNHTDDQGVYQINTVHGMPDMFNPTANIAYAYTIFKAQGTTPWDSSAHCWKEML